MRAAFIDHSYHRQTVSTKFIRDIVLAGCEVDEWWDHGWQGGNEVDTREVAAAGYDLIVVVQVATAVRGLTAIEGTNVVFVPMWDSSRNLTDAFWHEVKDARIVAFSYPLHARMLRLGLCSAYFQYFPDPSTFLPVTNFDSLRGFFWQRRGEITWDEIRELTRGSEFSDFHVHLAQDPGAETNVRPRAGKSVPTRLTTSSWFADRTDYYECLSRSNVFFAPRVAEGIGHSFLEAMALGMCVVASNASTMHEYITHGLTGLLWDVDRPRPIDFSDIASMAALARKRIEQGYEEWLRDQERLLAFSWTPTPEATPLLRGSTVVDTARSQERRRARLELADSVEPQRIPGAKKQGGRRTEGLLFRDRADMPLVSVVTVTLNCGDALEETLRATLAQDYPNIEILVIDGGSTDATLDVIKANESEIDLWLSAHDRGPYDAMNKAAQLARGRYCLFMNAGDWFVSPEAVSRALEDAPPTADFIIGHHLYRTLEGIDELHKASAFEATWRCLMEGNLSWQWLSGVPGHQATFVRTQLLRASGYDAKFTIAADHEFMYRQRLNGAHFHHCDRVIALYTSGGFSWQNQIRCFQDWVEIARLYGPPEAAERLFRPAIRSAILSTRTEPTDLSSVRTVVGVLNRSAFTAAARRIVESSDLATRAALRARATTVKAVSRATRAAERYRGTRDRSVAHRLRESGLFAEKWYLDTYPDVRAAGVDPVHHYIHEGADELRDPSPFFNTAFYRETNPDVAASGVNPLLHYLSSGAAAGRAPNPWLAESAAATDRAALETIVEKFASLQLSDLRR